MARFVFELDPLLDLRRREERDRMRVVAELEGERLEIERAAREIEARVAEERRLLRGELAPDRPVDLVRIRSQVGASLHGMRQTGELALRAAAVAKRLGAARERLLAATTARRAVESLRERRLQAWLAEQRRVEAREMDDLVTARFGAGGETGAVA